MCAQKMSSNRILLPILSHTHSSLKNVSKFYENFPLKEEAEEFTKLWDTLKFHKGVYSKIALGISMPQVGIMKRGFILANINASTNRSLYKEGPKVYINPEIIGTSSEHKEDFEGCLSDPEIMCLIRRPTKIEVNFKCIDGKEKQVSLKDFEARVFLHELDHLDGILMRDRAIKIIDNPLYAKYLKKQKIFSP